MNATELKAAAERLVSHRLLASDCQHIWNCHQQCQWCHQSRRDIDVAFVADAFLARLDADKARAADRGRPIDRAWLQEHGESLGSGRYQLAGDDSCDGDDISVTMYATDEGPAFRMFVENVVRDVTTVGQILDPLEALLGIKLKGGS